MEVVTLKYPLVPLPLGNNRASALKLVGGNIRRERVSRLLSQEKLAGAVGINVRTVAKIEAGELNVRPETLERIRLALDCPLAKLVGSASDGSATSRGVVGFGGNNFAENL